MTHPLKRLQHLAGRFLLQFLCPGFPYELIRIADTRKPYLPNEQYHFSISHCGDYAAAIVSSDQRVGVDIETTSEKAERIRINFNSKRAIDIFTPPHGPTGIGLHLTTLLWSAKESVINGSGTVASIFENIYNWKASMKR